MDYSIHDAIEAGFNHVVFIIRKDIEKEFKEVIGDRIASICSSHNVTVDYAFQDINDIPGTLPEGRTKPWGTGQAVLAAKNVIDTPFIVINADDYYGKEGFRAVHEYLVNGGESCMAGFVLKNTLSDKLYGRIYRDGQDAACIYAGTNASVYIKNNEVTVEDATGQNICRQGKRIRGVVGDFGQGVGNGYYVEKSMTELRNLTRQEWQTRLAGQMVSTGTELQVTSYEELRSFIQEELGELFEEDVQK